jgi:hypothetical protein
VVHHLRRQFARRLLGEDIGRRGNADARKAGISADEHIVSKTPPDQMVQALAVDKLAADFGSWKTPWGDINRRGLTDDIVHPFNDAGPSIPWVQLRAVGIAGVVRRAHLPVEEVRHDRQSSSRLSSSATRSRRAR